MNNLTAREILGINEGLCMVSYLQMLTRLSGFGTKMD